MQPNTLSEVVAAGRDPSVVVPIEVGERYRASRAARSRRSRERLAEVVLVAATLGMVAVLCAALHHAAQPPQLMEYGVGMLGPH